MFHRVPFISPTSVVTAAVILVLAALFALSLSSPGTAHASHSSPPTVSILSITPEVGEEDRNLRVTLQLSRPLTEDEEYCYDGRGPNEEPRDEVCIQGGIIVWDTYNDHLSDERAGDSDQWVKFVFRGGETEKRLTFKAKPDDCITPDRTIRVAVNTVFDELDDYGYIIDETEHTVHVSGDDTTNGELFENGGKCLPVDDGATEEIIQNRAPEFSSLPITLSVVENTDADVNIGEPGGRHRPGGATS